MRHCAEHSTAVTIARFDPAGESRSLRRFAPLYPEALTIAALRIALDRAQGMNPARCMPSRPISSAASQKPA
jgi:hypothetical protein